MEYHQYHKVKDIVHPSLKSNRLDNLIQYCRDNNVRFKDKEFPPDKTSLIGNSQPADYRGQFNIVEWKRANELFGDNYNVFKGISPDDIRQGSLGNCYFLCSLSSLAEYPQLISRLFDFDQINSHGVHAVWLNINGAWTRYILDEYFPAYYNGQEYDLAFSKTDQRELWVILLEKAYAKAYRSYWEIIGGDPVHALRDLTGAPYVRIEDYSNLDLVWNKVYEANAKQFMMTCITKTSQVSEEKLNEGLVSGHAYTILDVKEVINSRGAKDRVFQIRNPWGKFEWNGDYSDSSNLWTPKQRQDFKIQTLDDGIFWMKIEDFIKFFEGIGILEIMPDYLSNAVTVKTSRLSMVRMQVTRESNITIGVDQLDSRTVDKPEYSYSYFRLTIGKLNGKKGITFVDSVVSPERNIFIKNKFPPGDYIILVEANWSSNLVDQFNLSTYSDSEVELELLPLNNKNYRMIEYYIWYDFSKRNLQNMAQKGTKTIQTANLQVPLTTYQYQNKAYALVLYVYKNNSSDYAVHQDVDYTNKKGFMPVGFNCNDENAQLIINPNDIDVLLFKMDPQSKGFTLSLQVSGDEVIPTRFSEDFVSLEIINSLGGYQPTPENPDAEVTARLEKRQEIKRDVARKILMEEIREQQEANKIAEQKRMQELAEERRLAEQEMIRRQAQQQNYGRNGNNGYNYSNGYPIANTSGQNFFDAYSKGNNRSSNPVGDWNSQRPNFFDDPDGVVVDNKPNDNNNCTIF